MAKRRFGRGGGKLSLTKLLVPVAAATITEPMLDSFISQFAGNLNILPMMPAGVQIDDVAKIGLGYFLGKKGGLIGDIAKVYAIFGARNIVAGFTSGMLRGTATTAQSNGATF